MIQIYTGDGKGKTTAALGLALRASGAGLKVYIGQFIKGKAYSELKSLKKIPQVKIEQYGSGCFLKYKPKQKDIDLASRGLEQIRKIITQKKYKLVILDEINVALHFGLLHVDQIVDLLKATPKNIELVLTGRQVPSELIRLADLVSEIKEIKHYYRKGKKARKGIEF